MKQQGKFNFLRKVLKAKCKKSGLNSLNEGDVCKVTFDYSGKNWIINGEIKVNSFIFRDHFFLLEKMELKNGLPVKVKG